MAFNFDTRNLEFPISSIQFIEPTAYEMATSTTAIVPVASAPLKAVDSSGRDMIKGGQTVDGGLIESIIASYTNLMQNSTALIILGVLAFFIAAEYGDVKGPLESMQDNVKGIIDDPTEPQWVKSIGRGALVILNFFHANKDKFIASLAVFMSYAAKPSSKNFFLTLTLSFALLFIKLSFLDMLILSQGLFLTVALRNPNYKFMVFAALIAYFTASVRLDDFIHPTSTPGSMPNTTLKRQRRTPPTPPPTVFTMPQRSGD